MVAKIILLVLLSIFACHVKSEFGVDVSTPINADAWQCLKNNGSTFAVIRIYRSLGKIDVNAAKTIKLARAAGFKVDGYIFPCFKCGNPRDQVRAAADNLRTNNALVETIWIDIEGTEYWGPSGQENVNFIQQLVDEVMNQNFTVGIYSSASQWNPITKSSTELGDVMLWYAHWDKQADFSDFKPFGGFSLPVMKQYVGNANACGVGVDLNFRTWC